MQELRTQGTPCHRVMEPRITDLFKGDGATHHRQCSTESPQLYESRHVISNNVVSTTSKGSDQP